MEFLIYVLPFLVVGGFVFMIYWTMRSENKHDNKNIQNDKHTAKWTSILQAPRLYQNAEEQKIHEKNLMENTSEIDHDFFYSNKLGIYNNSKNEHLSHTSTVKDFIFSINNIFNAIKKYKEALNINSYIIHVRTKRFISIEEEKRLREVAKSNGGNIAIERDISSWGQEKTDIHIITIKASFECIATLLSSFDESNISHIVIVDDYNPTIFTYRDKHEAFNYNYRIKIGIFLSDDSSDYIKNKCKVIMNYGIVKNTKQFLTAMARLIGGDASQLNYYEEIPI